MKMTKLKEEAAISRSELKQMYVEDAMLANGGRKRAAVEAEAEEWLETIQQAKRAVQKSMGFPVCLLYVCVKLPVGGAKFFMRCAPFETISDTSISA